jgi:hypothetical protein
MLNNVHIFFKSTFSKSSLLASLLLMTSLMLMVILLLLMFMLLLSFILLRLYMLLLTSILLQVLLLLLAVLLLGHLCSCPCPCCYYHPGCCYTCFCCCWVLLLLESLHHDFLKCLAVAYPSSLMPEKFSGPGGRPFHSPMAEKSSGLWIKTFDILSCRKTLVPVARPVPKFIDPVRENKPKTGSIKSGTGLLSMLQVGRNTVYH